MKILKYFLFVVLCSQFFSCTWVKSKFTRHDEQLLDQVEQTAIIEKGRILDENAFSEGGRLYFYPFVAGVGVEATDELDRVALSIVRGFMQSLSDAGTPYSLLKPSEVQQADYIIKGHIVGIGQEKGLKTFMFRKKKKHLSVQGEMRDKDDNKIILHFSHSLTTNDRNEDHKALGERIGSDLGLFFKSKIQGM